VTVLIGRARLAAALLAVATLAGLLPALVLNHHQAPVLAGSHASGLTDAAGYFTTNASTAAVILIVAAALSAMRPSSRWALMLRAIADVALAIALAVAFVQIGVYLGSYQLQALRWLPHLPFEAGAVAMALGAYLEARSARRLTGGMLAGTVIVVVVLLTTAALLEAFATPGGRA
jgi:hypothetical protein